MYWTLIEKQNMFYKKCIYNIFHKYIKFYEK